MGRGKASDTGSIVWHELVTADPAAASGFYRSLFSWDPASANDAADNSVTVSASRGAQASIVNRAAVPGLGDSCWLPCVAVRDVEETVKTVSDLGGTVISAPEERVGFGTFARIADPRGGALAVTTGAVQGAAARAPEPRAGLFVWEELLSRDPHGAGVFYCALFKWQLMRSDSPEMRDYHLFRREDEEVESGMLASPEKDGGPSRWLPYVGIDDMAGGLEAVERGGGIVHVPPRDLGGAGSVAVAADPGGALFALYAAAS